MRASTLTYGTVEAIITRAEADDERDEVQLE